MDQTCPNSKHTCHARIPLSLPLSHTHTHTHSVFWLELVRPVTGSACDLVGWCVRGQWRASHGPEQRAQRRLFVPGLALGTWVCVCWRVPGRAGAPGEGGEGGIQMPPSTASGPEAPLTPLHTLSRFLTCSVSHTHMQAHTCKHAHTHTHAYLHTQLLLLVSTEGIAPYYTDELDRLTN